MFTPATYRKLKYSVLAYLPTLESYVLKTDGSKLEVWRKLAAPVVGGITIHGINLEYVRDVDRVFRVIDHPDNRRLCPDLIGTIVTHQPAHAILQEIK